MKIKEILELTQTQPIAEVAKQYLTIGEKPTRQAMKRAGCYTIVGQAGWIFDDTESSLNLECSVYELAEEVARERNEDLKAAVDGYTADENYIPRRRHSFDLDIRVVKQLKLHCIRTDQTLYEVVEEAILQYLESEKNK